MTRPAACLLTTTMLLIGCMNTTADDERTDRSSSEQRPFIEIEVPPTYHVLGSYDPKWESYIREGIEMARAYWGSYGPTHVWIGGREDERAIDDATREAFIEEYCRWRIAETERTTEECRPYVTERFIDVIESDQPEAYLSWVDEKEQPEAELVFLNVHEWYHEEEVVPDPVLRGIHEYTHVFQMAFGTQPTWMMEGGAVFAESWLVHLQGRRPLEFNLSRIMQRAKSIRDTGLTIADMEDIDTAPEKVAGYHMELAYDTGAWAVAYLIHRSPGRSVARYRDEFHPMITEIGWRKALARYLDIEDEQAFYVAFERFMERPREEQVMILSELKP